MGAVRFPQADRRPGLTGGADAWEDGTAGLILSEDYSLLVNAYIGGRPPTVFGPLLTATVSAEAVLTGSMSADRLLAATISAQPVLTARLRVNE